MNKTDGLLSNLMEIIAAKNPLHGKKLAQNPHLQDTAYLAWAEDFLQRYQTYLVGAQRSLDQASDFYLRVVNDTLYEQIEFMRSGKYSCASFADAYKNVYSNPEVMDYYMNGLLLTQILWHHHYQVFRYFTQTVQRQAAGIRRYLEIGGGHGAYVAEAIRVLGDIVYYEVVDISPTSLDMCKGVVNNSRVTYNLQDIYLYKNTQPFDFITMGEILEHLETPAEMLIGVSKLLAPEGRVFLTTPINAPAIDHISLFTSPDHLKSIFASAGFEVVDELVLPTEAISLEAALERKIPVMYAALLRRA